MTYLPSYPQNHCSVTILLSSKLAKRANKVYLIVPPITLATGPPMLSAAPPSFSLPALRAATRALWRSWTMKGELAFLDETSRPLNSVLGVARSCSVRGVGVGSMIAACMLELTSKRFPDAWPALAGGLTALEATMCRSIVVEASLLQKG